MMLTQFFPDELAIQTFAGQLAQTVYKEMQGQPPDDAFIIFLSGDLGAGKTTFTRGFLRGLGYEEKVKSPTYTLVEPYHLMDITVLHVDLYRLHDPNELEYLGIYDYFKTATVCLIEWPEHGKPLLPEPDLSCYIDIKDEGRELQFEAYSERSKKILRNLAFIK